jgi:hypothetical protein
MKNNLVLILSTLFLFLSCYTEDKLLPETENAIEETLEKMAIENLKSWEPPFHEDLFLDLFTQSEDLFVVLDGFSINNYQRWKNVVIKSMQADRDQNFKLYKHSVNEINTAVLSAKSGVVTMKYTWDYITKDDLHYNKDAAVTLVFRLEKENWKIIHFNVSHGKEKLVQ